jgi:HD-GYP domain-containing protein (c-di-GMP phosphodiesterase class II)
VSGALQPSARPHDERLRAQGLQILLRFHALMRVGRSYQVGNAVFRQQLASFIAAVSPVFELAPEAVLVALESDLYLNGVRLPLTVSNLRFHQVLMQEFTRRRICGVRITPDVDDADLETFFRYFLQPGDYHGPVLLEACVAVGKGGILPVVHASTDSGGSDALDPSSYTDWSDSAPLPGLGPWAGGGGPAGGSGDGGGDPDGGGALGPAAAGARPATRKSYSLALLGARSLLTTTVLEDGMEMRHAKRVVQPLIDGAFREEPVVVGLSSLSHHDDYTYSHSVNVCMVAVTMGHVLGLGRRALSDLGVAALLHDVGKAAVYDLIRHPLEEFDEEERRLAESHPVAGAKLIARSTTLNGTTLRCLQVALEHHAVRRPDSGARDGGYPPLPAGWPVSRLSELVSAADAYVSLLMHRSAGGVDVTPYVALGMVLGPLAGQFDPLVLWALVRALGFYPPGQLVELSDGRIAVVLAPNGSDLARPNVRVVVDECGVPFSAIEAKELRPIPATLSVARALPAREYPRMAFGT